MKCLNIIIHSDERNKTHINLITNFVFMSNMKI